MKQDLVFEIGCEEIPASYLQPALDQMQNEAVAFFQTQRLDCVSIQTEGTPRRLALLCKGLQERQADRVEEVMGPSAKAAFDPQGKPTQAAEGFARSRGLEPGQLQVKPTPKGDYVFARFFQPGRFTADLLEERLPQLVRKLHFPKSMRWGQGGPLRFARPIHWLCALLGKRALKLKLEDIPCHAITFGHRFLAPKPIRLRHASEYRRRLKAAHVMLSFEERTARIRQGLARACSAWGGVVKDEELVATTANLVEEPAVLLGRFHSKYLELPEEIIIQALREHQYCFATRDKAGKLADAFLVVTNGCKTNLAEIRAGNAAVIRARLEDARFFFQEDRKVRLEQRLEELSQVVWLEGLGSLKDRVQRIERLTQWLAVHLAPVAPELSQMAIRAARICKSDLATLMIGEKEYAALQGIMGGIYARLEGEPEEVCLAIQEHYQPRFAGDSIPSTRVGQLLALADKLDELAGCFGSGFIPSGSQDPYALRRKAYGVLAILRVQEQDLSLQELLQAAVEGYGGRLKQPAVDLIRQLRDFFRQRLEQLLQEEGFAPDLVEAVLWQRHDLCREAFSRARALAGLQSRDDWELVTTAFSRVTNILPQDLNLKPVQEGLLQEGPERTLYERFMALRPVVERACAAGDFRAAFNQLASLRPEIDAYFGGVLVMAGDALLRQNRLVFLKQISQTLNLIADFTKLLQRKETP